jgi:hypothetical protein
MAENSNTWGNAGADRVQRFFWVDLTLFLIIMI